MRAAIPLGLASLRDLVREGVRFVNRQNGSGTRLFTDQLLQSEGIAATTIAGYGDGAEDSHLAVAAAVASGSADAGVGIEAAAQRYGLHFVPLADEDYFLVCLRDALDQPAVLKLREVLASATWQRDLAGSAGLRRRPRRSGVVADAGAAVVAVSRAQEQTHGALTATTRQGARRASRYVECVHIAAHRPLAVGSQACTSLLPPSRRTRNLRAARRSRCGVWRPA